MHLKAYYCWKVWGKDGHRKLTFLVAVHLISTPPSSEQKRVDEVSTVVLVWVSTGGSGLYCLYLVTCNETELSHESPVIYTFVWTGRGIYNPRRRDGQKSNSANYACHGCSIQTRKLCRIPCCGKSIRCSEEQLKSLCIFSAREWWLGRYEIWYGCQARRRHLKPHVMT